jgi:hypothetical protein
VDSDLIESISALKESLKLLGLDAHFGSAEPRTLTLLKERFGLPRRYLEFLAESNPLNVGTATPAEQVQFVAAADLIAEQVDHSIGPDGQLISKPTLRGWRPSWFVLARSALLGDPYFVDTTQVDAEGGGPIFTAMSGTRVWQPKLCASSLATFVRILAVTMEVAEGFDLDDYDPDNERVFREAIKPHIQEVDAAALRAGHWT